jgi:hypothetical protein
LIDGKPKALNIPTQLMEKVREKIEMRRRFDAAAATICGVNLKRFLKAWNRPDESPKPWPAYFACLAFPHTTYPKTSIKQPIW